MSSLVRRLEIRALKGMGFRRTKFHQRTDEQGRKYLSPVVRGGLILDPHDKPVGYRWPRRAVA